MRGGGGGGGEDGDSDDGRRLGPVSMAVAVLNGCCGSQWPFSCGSLLTKPTGAAYGEVSRVWCCTWKERERGGGERERESKIARGREREGEGGREVSEMLCNITRRLSLVGLVMFVTPPPPPPPPFFPPSPPPPHTHFPLLSSSWTRCGPARCSSRLRGGRSTPSRRRWLQNPRTSCRDMNLEHLRLKAHQVRELCVQLRALMHAH